MKSPLPEVPKPDMGPTLTIERGNMVFYAWPKSEASKFAFRLPKSTVLRHDTLDNKGKV